MFFSHSFLRVVMICSLASMRAHHFDSASFESVGASVAAGCADSGGVRLSMMLHTKRSVSVRAPPHGIDAQHRAPCAGRQLLFQPAGGAHRTAHRTRRAGGLWAAIDDIAERVERVI